MTHRSTTSLLIPAAQTIGLVLTSGCSDPAIGEWTLSALTTHTTDDSTTTKFPTVYTEDETSTRSGIRMTIQASGDGELTNYLSYTYYGQTYDQQAVYSLVATRQAKGTWDIRIDDGSDMTLSCSSGKALNGDEDGEWLELDTSKARDLMRCSTPLEETTIIWHWARESTD